MRQILLEIGSGDLAVDTVPAPAARPGFLTVESSTSVISGGTERMLLEFGRSGLLEKIRSQPERVKQIIDRAVTEGLLSTLAAVRDKLTDTIPLGYCQAGVVREVGDAHAPFALGDRVVTNGPHGEIVRVPYHLAARIPDGVDYETAAFTPLAAIGLQGIRLAKPTLGETVVVFGLGLIGQLTVQMVRAHGCRCIGIDVDPARVALAEQFGAVGLLAAGDSPADQVRHLTGGRGTDAVLMTLATESDEPVRQAAAMSRKRGRVVLIGTTGLGLQRADFYEKELTLQVSCSYGPGRYDPDYEQKGHDYPLPFVRWTEQRNFEAVLGLMADGRLTTRDLVTHRFTLEEAPDAYELLLSDEPSLAIVLSYPADGGKRLERRIRLAAPQRAEPGSGVAGVIGSGNYARRTLLPAMRSAGIEVRTIVSSAGLSAAVEGRRADAAYASSDVRAVLDDPEIDTVFVLTRHDSHARLAARAIEAGKHVFVEKPLGLSMAEIAELQRAAEGSERILTVGFNRRFAPLASELKALVDARSGPLTLVVTANAGHLDQGHWLQDPAIGGGRILGEACHYIDLVRFLTGSPIADLSVVAARDSGGRRLDDVAHLAIDFESGSTAVIHYLATGATRFPKERVEAFFDGKTATIENWRRLRTWGLGRRDRLFGRRPDKGHVAELTALVRAVREGGPPPIPIDEIFEVSRWSIRAARQARGEASPG